MFEKIAGIIGCRKLSADILWNIGALAVTGISGILLNILIAAFYGAEALGIFNQCYAFFILFSQFGSVGVHYSILKHIPENPGDKKYVSASVTSGLLITFLFSATVSVGLYFLSDICGDILNSTSTARGIRLAIIGVFLLPVNKLIASSFNGLRYMKIFAVLQTLRAVLWLLAISGFLYYKKSGDDLAAVLSLGEAGVFLLSALLFLLKIKPSLCAYRKWLSIHLSFGIRGMLTGVLTDLNTRIDVLMLGYFLGDVQVGIYSLAAILAEGALQLLVVIRNNFNPLISSLLHESKFTELQKLASSSRKWIWPFVAGCALAAVAGFATVAHIYTEKGFSASVPCFVILMLGVVLCSGYYPFTMIFIQSGRPGMQTKVTFSLLVFNAAFNALLIPFLGIEGAAIATATSFVFFAVLTIILCRKYINDKIL